MAPADLSGLVVDRNNHSLSPYSVVCARPTVDSIGWFGKVKTPARMRVDNKQSILCVKARRTIVGHPAFVRRNQSSVGGWFFRGIRNRATLLIDAKRPVYRAERRGQKILTVGAIEYEEIAVARSLHQHFLRLAMKVSIHQDRS